MQYKAYWDKKNTSFLILHWWGWSSNSWEKVAKKLSERFFVIVPDIPCASKREVRKVSEEVWREWKMNSEKWIVNNEFSDNFLKNNQESSCDRVYTLDDYARLIRDFVNELGLKDFILMGHSNWGAIATKLVVNYQDLPVKKLILNNTAWIRKDRKRSLKRKVFWTIAKVVKPIFALPWMWKIRNLFYKLIWWHDYLEAEKNPNKKQTYLNMINSDLQDIFPKISKDTLIIWWENDTYTPLEDGQKIHNFIKNSKFVEIKNVRHGIHLQNPDELVKVILENI